MPLLQGEASAGDAAYLEERVLPHVTHRQWLLSFPHQVRWGC